MFEILFVSGVATLLMAFLFFVLPNLAAGTR